MGILSTRYPVWYSVGAVGSINVCFLDQVLSGDGLIEVDRDMFILVYLIDKFDNEEVSDFIIDFTFEFITEGLL